MVDVSKLVITEFTQLTAFNNAGECEFVIDEISEGSMSNGEEKTDITGRNGRKIGALKRNKTANLSVTNGMLSGGALAAQTGSDIVTGDNFKVRVTETVTVKSNAATLTHTPVGKAGSEIVAAYKREGDIVKLSKAYTQASATTEAGKFTYTAEGKALAFHAGDFADGDQIVLYFDVEVSGAKITNSTEHYSKTLAIYADIILQDSCDNVYFGQITIPRGDFSGEFELGLGGDNFAHSIEIEALAGGCTGSANLWDIVVFEEITAA